MKPLSSRQAYNCENAVRPRCKCRCGGALHGASRGGATPTREFFTTLEADDPHYVKPKDKYVQLKMFAVLEMETA